MGGSIGESLEKLTPQDISFAQGFIEEWLKDAPDPVKEHLNVLVDGVAFYREKYIIAQEDYDRLQNNYNQLTALSASYLGLLEQQKEEINGLLIETQREFHKTEPEREFGAF